MTLITILVCLGLQHFLNFGNWFKQSGFEVYLGWLKPITNKTGDWLGIIITVLPIFIILGLINYILGMYWLGFLKLLFGVVILLGCLNAEKLSTELGVQEIFVAAYERIFAILFWYIIFGVYGIAVYVPISMLTTNSKATIVKNWLDWIPVRLLSLSYALVGHFATEFDLLQKDFFGGSKQTMVLKQDAGKAALTSDDPHAAIAIIHRALIVWLVVVAILTIITWLT